MTSSNFPEQHDRCDGGGHSPSSPADDDVTPTSPETPSPEAPADDASQAAEGAPGEAGPEAASEPAADAAVGEPLAEDDPTADLRRQLAERTEDLQRLQAEYVNYRKRVERDRLVARDLTVVAFVEAFLPMLDDIDSARAHGDLAEGTPFGAIIEKFEGVLTKFGWERYGEKGEPFDPNIHEAFLHSHSPDVTETTVGEVLQSGHRAGDRIVRAARVAVLDPEE